MAISIDSEKPSMKPRTLVLTLPAPLNRSNTRPLSFTILYFHLPRRRRTRRGMGSRTAFKILWTVRVHAGTVLAIWLMLSLYFRRR